MTDVFERRLKAFLAALGVVLLVIVGRLAELQIVRGDYYGRRAERVLRRRPERLPFIRGSIVDRTGEVLVSDEPSWDLTVDYRVLAAAVADDPVAWKLALKKWKRPYPRGWTRDQVEQAFRHDLTTMWRALAGQSALYSSPRSVTELQERARAICDRVQRIRATVAARRGFDSPVAEETLAHPILAGLDSQSQIAARTAFKAYPWVQVEPSSARTFAGDVTALAHVLGRMGPVDAAAVASDPNADDVFACYHGDEDRGISGVEFAAEQILRGRRGEITKDRDGELVEPVIEAENGHDVTLTIHAELQRRLYRILGEAVRLLPDSSGGAIVVLEVPTREVLALVSYPSYDPRLFHELYPALRDDTSRLPLRFRPVQNAYAPGSTVKPLVCLAGLMTGRITLETRETCTGYLFEDLRDRWRCWEVRGTGIRKAHGTIDVVEALRASCNVFMYRLGEKVGVDGLCDAFDMFGIGRSTGIGLREEVSGVNPTPSWLMVHRDSPTYPAHARLFAIGQGELLATPLQVANLMATYASGCYRPVTLMRTERATPVWQIPATSAHWAAIRRGIYQVVNDPEGTAYKYAHFVNDYYALCGKTGSATAPPWPTAYRVPYLDAEGEPNVAVVRAGAKRPALDRFVAEHPQATFEPNEVEVASKWPPVPPPAGENYSHAWFGGYLQPLTDDRQPDWSQEPRIAFAALVEFGGSGGRTSGPVAKKVAAEVLDVFGPDLRVAPMTLAEVPP